ncbi:alpha/beta hydrolase [Thalassotalea maritima]|uniref:alpha/beta hydrolase n=1 Tax=Thalassotalea maritima TaxID=3242416 RepID=UPI003528455C
MINIFKYLILCLLALVVGVAVWMSIPYPHQHAAAEQALQSTTGITVNREGYLSFAPQLRTHVGLIIYPGGKTSADTFAPLAHNFAIHGLFVAVVPMPLNTAFLGINKANDVIEQHPEIDTWFIAGHSLGGVAAAEYAKSANDKLAGLMFWASYPGSDISHLTLPVLSIVADKDLQSTPVKIASHQEKMPERTEFSYIEGGNHWHFAHFADTLNEQHDLISRTEQQNLVLRHTLDFVSKVAD